ncbi:MAG: NPCBM/NEW2 domain-containing protein [Verrucomicrobiaceae bacterium]|nr:NPCBM/NEW2 domain-containing protein [Verrucomicrobiaceae bacterium]
MNSWYYSHSAQTFGPVTKEQLIAMIQAGQLMGEHFIMREGADEWLAVNASPFSGYLPPKATMAMPAPFAGASATPQAAPAAQPIAKPAARPAGPPQARPAAPRSNAPAAKMASKGAKTPRALVFGTLGVLVAALGWHFLVPKTNPGRKMTKRLEGEVLKVIKVTGGDVEPQGMKQTNALWSGDAHLFWRGGAAGYSLDLEFKVEEDQGGKQRLKAAFTSSYDYGTIEVSLDGKKLKGSIFDLQANGAVISGARDLGLHDLAAGPHVLRIGILDTSVINMDKRDAYGVGLDYLQLEPPVSDAVPATAGTNIAAKAQPSASFCGGGDHVLNMKTGEERPDRKSEDQSLSRFTWHAHKGSAEWAQYEWESPQAIGECRVFWYADNTVPGGGCALPNFWRLLYREESTDAWVPVDATIPAATRDTWNSVKFTPVKTTALRIAVQCQENFSAGIIHWQALAADPAAVPDAKSREHPDLFLGDLSPLHAQVGYIPFQINTVVEWERRNNNASVMVGRMPCSQFLWAHANSRLDFAIPEGYTRFTAFGVGYSDVRTGELLAHGDWKHQVLVDGKVMEFSNPLSSYKSHEFPIDITFPAGSKVLTLLTDNLGDGNYDHAHWAYPTFLTASSQKRPATPTMTDKWPKLTASAHVSAVAPSSSVASSRQTAPQSSPPARDIELRPSRDGGDPCDIRITNKLSEEVKIQLVGENGKPGYASSLKAGKTISHGTYIGHVRLITEKNGGRLGLVESKADKTTVTIDAQGVHVQEEAPPTRESQQLISMVQLTESSIGDAVALLRQRATEAKLNVQIELAPGVDAKAGSISLDAREGPLEDILGTSAHQAGLRYQQQGSTYTLTPR